MSGPCGLCKSGHADPDNVCVDCGRVVCGFCWLGYGRCLGCQIRYENRGRFPIAEEQAVAPPMHHRTPVTILYTNHRGETALRRILPEGVSFGSSEWHPEEQWLLLAYDLDKGGRRHFAMRDIQEWHFSDSDGSEVAPG